jgi:hypothetical protein
VGSYRQRPILAAAFSLDGSVLAVAASEFLTLWNPATNGLIRVLSNSIVQPLQPIHHLAFVNQSTCLVAASSGEMPLLTVWDISTLSVRWCQAISAESLSVDPARASFAVLAGVPSATYYEGKHLIQLSNELFCAQNRAVRKKSNFQSSFHVFESRCVIDLCHGSLGWAEIWNLVLLAASLSICTVGFLKTEIFEKIIWDGESTE